MLGSTNFWVGVLVGVGGVYAWKRFSMRGQAASS